MGVAASAPARKRTVAVVRDIVILKAQKLMWEVSVLVLAAVVVAILDGVLTYLSNK